MHQTNKDMTSQTDKLFQSKLENFQQPAPSGAWERIESNLDKRNSKIVWAKVAATIALLAVATLILWHTSGVNEEGIAKTKTETQQKNPAKADAKTVTPAPASTESTKQPALSVKGNSTKRVLQERIQPSPEKISEPNATKNSLEPSTIEIVPTETVAIIESPSSTNAVASNTIVYTAEEVNAKYLRKKTPADATADEKKTSGMQKLIGLAYALKNNESGLDLRQKKDEILALNFLNEDKNNKVKN